MMMMMGFGLIVLLVPLFLIGVVAYALGWRPQFNQKWTDQTGQTPFEILEARYARGEISREEHEQMRQDLKEGDKTK